MQDNLVSIIWPCFNPSKKNAHSISSILNQKYKNFELLIIDDFSSNDIYEWCSLHATDPRIKILRMSYNSGGGGARNLGLKSSNGKFIAFCDSDDIWPDDKLQVQLDFMIDNNLKISHTDKINFVSSTNNSTSRTHSSSIITLDSFLVNTDIYCSSVILSREILKDDFLFGTMRKRHPFKFWVKILENNFKSVRCPDTFFYYRVSSNSISSNKGSVLLYTFIAYFLYPKNKVKSLFFFLRILKGSTRD